MCLCFHGHFQFLRANFFLCAFAFSLTLFLVYSYQVLVSGTSLCKCHSTDMTRVRPFASVDDQVVFHVSRDFAAHRTLFALSFWYVGVGDVLPQLLVFLTAEGTA